MGFERLEDKRLYRDAEAVADALWEVVMRWDEFAKRNVGGQLVRAVDSIGANIAEAGGRFHPADVKNLLYYARGSLQETIYFVRRAVARQLLSVEAANQTLAQLDKLHLEINGLIAHQTRRQQKPPNNPTTQPPNLPRSPANTPETPSGPAPTAP